MTSLDTPATEAGRALLADTLNRNFHPDMLAGIGRSAILAIEAEAIANHDAALRVAVVAAFDKLRREKVRSPYNGGDSEDAFVGYALNDAETAVLALLSEGTPEPGLDAAWREAEAALPGGWWFRVTRAKSGAVSAVAADPRNRWDWKGNGPTPTAALQALAAALREQPEKEQAGG